MPYQVKDQLYLDVRFEGESFPFDVNSGLNYIHVSEGIQQSVPYLSMSLNDAARWMATKRYLRDGTRISVTYGAGSLDESSAVTVEFVLVAYKTKDSVQGVTYTVDAILDIPKYISTVTTRCLTGSSSDVLSRVAQQIGISFEGVGTSDSMNWFPSGKTLSQFVSYVTQHSYATESSCMRSAITLDRKLLLRDITAMDAASKTLGVQIFDNKDVIPVTSIYPHEEPGGSNLTSGYASGGVEHVVDVDDALHLEHKAIAAHINEGGDLSMNDSVKASVDRGRTSQYPLSARDNTHEFFDRAVYQNRRGMLLFTSALDVVTPIVSGVRVLDTVLVDMSKAHQEQGVGLTRYEGTYRVLHKVTYITPNRFCEKLCLSRRTTDFGNTVPKPQEDKGTLITNLEALTSKFSSPELPALKLPFDLAGFAAAAGAAVAAVAVAKGLADNVANNSAASMQQLTQQAEDNQFTVLYDALVADMESMTAIAAADVTAIKTAAALDWTTQANTRIGQWTQDITTLRTEREPAIAGEALKAQRSAELAMSAAATLGDTSAELAAATQSATAMEGALTQLGAPAPASTNAAQMEANNATSAQQTAAQQQQTNVQMQALLNKSSNWKQNLDTLQQTEYDSLVLIVNTP